MKTWRMVLVSAFFPITLGVSALLVGCNDDVDTPPWYPNYTDSGYGGAKAKGGAGGGAGASGAGGSQNAGSGGASAAGKAGAS